MAYQPQHILSIRRMVLRVKPSIIGDIPYGGIAKVPLSPFSDWQRTNAGYALEVQ
jgi:hypothetical protein